MDFVLKKDQKEEDKANDNNSSLLKPAAHPSKTSWGSSNNQAFFAEIKGWRNASSKDIPEIKKLITEDTDYFFGLVDIHLLVELALYAFALENTNDNIVSLLCFNSYPNIAALSPEFWLYWIRFHYQLTSINYGNALFIHYIAWDLRYNPKAMKCVLTEVFLDNPKLEYICVVAPPVERGVFDDVLSIFFTRALPTENIGLDRTQAVYICNRSNILPAFKIRKALPEDNDELMEIIDLNYPGYREKFGEFNIANMLLESTENPSIIVAEINNQAVGMMQLNRNVDLNKINKNYELLPFQSLRKYCPNIHTVERSYLDVIKKKSCEFFETLSASASESESDGIDGNEYVNYEMYSGNSSQLESLSSGCRPDLSVLTLEKILQSFHDQSSSFFSESIKIDWNEISTKYRKPENYIEKGRKLVKEPRTSSKAFAIELFGVHPTIDERQIFDILKAAFESFPDKPYCLMSLSTSIPIPTILNYFTVGVIPRPECFINDSLYVVHKNAIVGQVKVSRITGCDLQQIKNMLQYRTDQEIKPAKEMMNMIRNSLMSTQKQYDALIVRSERTLVGVIILSLTDNLKLLQKYFDLDEYANFDCLYQPQYHGKILYLYLNPLFEALSSFIFREICRLTGYHSIYFAVEDSVNLNLYNNLLSEMYPVMPRRILHTHSREDFPNIGVPDDAFKELKAFPLYYQNIKLSSKQRKNIDLKIVIIGFGRITKSFLETILFKKYLQKLKFTNLTVLVAPGAAEAWFSDLTRNCMLFSYFPKYRPDYIRRLEFRTWVNFVSGTIIKVDRKAKYVILNNNRKLKYDVLFFFGGSIFGLPFEVPLNADIPSNTAVVNQRLDANILQYKVAMIKKLCKSGYNIIVYGKAVQAWACVNFLLNEKIKGKHIHFVMPDEVKTDRANVSGFFDDYIEKRAFEEVAKANVNIYNGFRFVRWTVENGVLKSICFQSTFKCIDLSCTLFISYVRKSMSMTLSKAIQRSGIVIDGHVVIDGQYKTNDPYIYAAGSFTKYRRIFCADKYRHVFYNHHEVAANLAHQIGKDLLMSKTSHEAMNIKKRPCFVIPNYEKPFMRQVFLPGNYYLIIIKAPGYKLPYWIAREMDNYGEDLITGRDDDTSSSSTIPEASCGKEGYFRVQLDKKGFIVEIYCLSKEYQFLEYLYRLLGLHESFLGNLKKRYQAGEINDFFKFFRSNWIIALTHDRFWQLRNMNQLTQFNYLAQNNVVREFIQKMFKGKKRNLSRCERLAISACVQNEKCIKEIEENLITFLGLEQDSFFMYATPEIIDKTFSTNKSNFSK